MGKNYLNKDVYTAAQERIKFIFDEFKNIYVSFSSGKDSGCVLNMAIDEARKRGRRIGVLFIDLEAFYKKSIEFVERMFNDNKDVIIPYWVCLPLSQPNALSFLEPYWLCWAKDKKEIWTREMPDYPYVINEDNNPLDFYELNMTFENFIKHFGAWYGKGEKTACLIGIRTDESLNRFRAIVSDKTKYKDKIYSTKVEDNVYNFYPLYDWSVSDIWTYNGKFKKDYNRLYDLFYKAGIPLHKMRVDEPYGNESKAGLNMFRVIEPETWQRVVNRVSGANFGCIYHGNKIMTVKHPLPKNHTWKSYTEFLLSTLPKETADHYRKKFTTFIRAWQEQGCVLSDEHIKELEDTIPDKITNTHTFSKRGKGDKEVVKFNEIVDEHPLDQKRDVLTWKRMAMCIIKNDYVCKSLCFSITKDLTDRQKEIMERYKNL